MKVRDAGRLKRGIPVRLEVFIRAGDAGGLREDVLAARGVLELQLAQSLKRRTCERQRARLVVLRLAHQCPPLLQIDVLPLEVRQFSSARTGGDREKYERAKRRPLGRGAGVE